MRQISVAVGESLSFVCTDPAAESGDSRSNTHTVTCQPDGTLPSGKQTDTTQNQLKQQLTYNAKVVFMNL